MHASDNFSLAVCHRPPSLKNFPRSTIMSAWYPQTSSKAGNRIAQRFQSTIKTTRPFYILELMILKVRKCLLIAYRQTHKDMCFMSSKSMKLEIVFEHKVVEIILS